MNLDFSSFWVDAEIYFLVIMAFYVRILTKFKNNLTTYAATIPRTHKHALHSYIHTQPRTFQYTHTPFHIRNTHERTQLLAAHIHTYGQTFEATYNQGAS